MEFVLFKSPNQHLSTLHQLFGTIDIYRFETLITKVLHDPS